MRMQSKPGLSRFRLRAALLLFAGCTALTLTPVVHAAASTEVLEQRLQQLAGELDAVKAELAELKAQRTAAANGASPAASAPVPTAAAAPAVAAASAGPTLFGYGELNYTRPSDAPVEATADLARFVIGVGYAFDERTHLNSEIELEHAVSSADDRGEIEIEQAYIDRTLGHGLTARAGLMLMPVGLLNENHEPTRFYGAVRNHVETAIIPTTWREGGVALQGDTAGGLRWNVGLTTGFDLSKWDPTSSEGTESPLGSIHQELSLARAHDLSGFVALDYLGVPGLRLGGSLFSGGAGQGQPLFDQSRVTLWEAHARWTPGNADLSALYARGGISGTGAINTTLVGNPTLIPERFDGWYVQGAYRLFADRAFPLAPFLRYERYNTGSRYAPIAAGLTPAALPDHQVWTGGVNLGIARGVVVKADYQWFRHGEQTGDSDRLDVGLGYEF
jgi:hypothetical protein